MKRIVQNLSTGERAEVDFSAKEVEDILAHKAAYESSAGAILAAKEQAAVSAVKSDSTIAYLRTHTPDECYDKVQADVTDLASAKKMIGSLAMALCILVRRI